MKLNHLTRRGLAALTACAALAATATATATATAARSEPPPTSAPLDPVVAGVDWGEQAYEVACGAAQRLELAGGRFEPAEYNGVGGVLIVELTGVRQLPARDGYVLVQLSCIAGGPSAALSQELFLAIEVDGDTGRGNETPDGTQPGTTSAPGPVIAAVLFAEPGAAHVVNDDGVVVVDDVVHGASDPQCCPSVARSQQIVWDDSGLPVVVAGARPDALPADGPPSPTACVATELSAAAGTSDDVAALETALATAGFDPGPVDGTLDDATINAVVRFVEFNAGNPALHDDGPDRPYDNLHAEASRHGIVRRAVLAALGIACDDVTRLPAAAG